MKKNNSNNLFSFYIIAAIPLILFGLYKNGIDLYQKGLVSFLGALKPLILIVMAVIGAFIGIIIREFKKSKLNLKTFEKIKMPVVEALVYAMVLPLKTSPIVILLVSLIINIFYKKDKLNKIVLMVLITLLINQLMGLNTFQNARELSNLVNYDAMDKFLGFIKGGICSTNIFLVLCTLIFLSFNKMYKKDIAIFSILAFAILVLVPCIIEANYNNIFDVLFGYNVLFALVLIAPEMKSTSYSTKGQILSGVILGALTYFLVNPLGYFSVFVSILIINLLSGIFDRVFVIK